MYLSIADAMCQTILLTINIGKKLLLQVLASCALGFVSLLVCCIQGNFQVARSQVGYEIIGMIALAGLMWGLLAMKGCFVRQTVMMNEPINDHRALSGAWCQAVKQAKQGAIQVGTWIPRMVWAILFLGENTCSTE